MINDIYDNVVITIRVIVSATNDFIINMCLQSYCCII